MARPRGQFFVHVPGGLSGGVTEPEALPQSDQGRSHFALDREGQTDVWNPCPSKHRHHSGRHRALGLCEVDSWIFVSIALWSIGIPDGPSWGSRRTLRYGQNGAFDLWKESNGLETHQGVVVGLLCDATEVLDPAIFRGGAPSPMGASVHTFRCGGFGITPFGLGSISAPIQLDEWHGCPF